MKLSASLTVILVISVITIILFPIFTVLFQHPMFQKILTENILNEGVSLASNLSSVLTIGAADLESETISPQLKGQVETLQEDRRFVKLKIFSASGRIIYSTDPQEIGIVNTGVYLREIIKSGKPHIKDVPESKKSSERLPVPTHFVEAYVPIVKSNRVLGVFEIYYDITVEHKKFEGLIYRFTGVLFGMAVLLLAGVLFSTRKASQYLKARDQVEKRLLHLSHTDELTGLYNRRGFFTLAEQQFKMAKRLKTKILLVSADVNGLKWINDNLGHHEGDRALVEAADILRESYRDSDIIARVGGDEFVVLMAERDDISRDVLTSRLKENLDMHQSRQPGTYELSISVGTVLYDPENPSSLDELMISADRLMYENKRQTKRSRRR